MQANDRILHLFAKYRDKAISPEELEELLVWLHGLDEQQSEMLAASQKDLWEKAKAGMLESATVDWDSILQQALRPDVPVNQKPVRHLWWRWAAAAVLILSLGIGVYFLVQNKKEESGLAEQPLQRLPENVLPNTRQSYLTLSNGNRILLDSAEKGSIAERVVKLQDGEIRYDQGPVNAEPEYHTVTVPRGGRPYQLLLADGTKIWLNAASTLRYPSFFKGSRRDVEMTGEAYFEVAKNPSQPFHVTSNGMEVEVLGTHFNMMTYPDESNIQTTLIEGSVRMFSSTGSSAMLKPGQQAQLTGNNITVAAVNTDISIAWVKGYFQFDKADVPSILRQVGRWYDLDIAYAGKIPTDLFSGRIARDLPLSGIVKLLAQGNIQMKVEGRRLIVL